MRQPPRTQRRRRNNRNKTARNATFRIVFARSPRILETAWIRRAGSGQTYPRREESRDEYLTPTPDRNGTREELSGGTNVRCWRLRARPLGGNGRPRESAPASVPCGKSEWRYCNWRSRTHDRG